MGIYEAALYQIRPLLPLGQYYLHELEVALQSFKILTTTWKLEILYMQNRGILKEVEV